MMKICITAANCFIGFPLVKKASESGWEVLAVVREGNRRRKELEAIKNVSVIELNLQDYGKIGERLGAIDCLVMLTWNGTRGQTRNNAKIQKSNYEYCLAGIKSAIKNGCKKVLTAGSQAEYGLVNEKITEETICNPISEYGKSKLRLYNDVSMLCKENKVVHIEPRFFSLYGPGDYENTLVMSNIHKMKANEDCDITECSQMWDFLYIDDATEALFKLCEGNYPSGVYNFGSGDCKPLREYVLEMRDVLNSSSKLNFGAIPYELSGMVNINPSVEKLKKELNWKPKISFASGIERIIKTI